MHYKDIALSKETKTSKDKGKAGTIAPISKHNRSWTSFWPLSEGSNEEGGGAQKEGTSRGSGDVQGIVLILLFYKMSGPDNCIHWGQMNVSGD